MIFPVSAYRSPNRVSAFRGGASIAKREGASETQACALTAARL